MTPLQKLRTSFTTRLALWVAAFVVIITGLVIGLLARFYESVILDETVDATLQALENTALDIDNTLRRMEMTARLEGRRIRVNRASVNQLIGESGSEEKLRQLLPHAQLFVTRRDSSHLDAYITGGERGWRRLVHGGHEMYIFSQPLGQRQFCIVATTPADDIHKRHSQMHRVLTLWGVGGVLVLLTLLYYVIARHLRPLHLLADAAQSIAGGNLETPIPDAHHQHEAARLQASLKKMQRSLRSYMDEMQQKRATLSAHHADLQAAYGEAQEYEAMRAKFLTEMTAQMAAPVEQLCQSTNIICRDFDKLKRNEMAALEVDIMNGTEKITALLDKVMSRAAETLPKAPPATP